MHKKVRPPRLFINFLKKISLEAAGWQDRMCVPGPPSIIILYANECLKLYLKAIFYVILEEFECESGRSHILVSYAAAAKEVVVMWVRYFQMLKRSLLCSPIIVDPLYFIFKPLILIFLHLENKTSSKKVCLLSGNYNSA